VIWSLTESTFTKYSASGAYHWSKLDGKGLAAYHARLHSRYGWFVAKASQAKPGPIVDVGCGDAALTHLLATATGQRTFGVEPEEAGVALAERVLAEHGSTASVVQGSGDRIPLEDGFAEVVSLCEVIEHLPEPQAVLSEIARVLKPGGTLLVSTPLAQEELADPFHVREYTPGELGSELESPFTDVSVSVAEPGFLVDLYATRLGRRAVNAFAMRGLDPFSRVSEPSDRRDGFRQLYATGSKP